MKQAKTREEGCENIGYADEPTYEEGIEKGKRQALEEVEKMIDNLDILEMLNNAEYYTTNSDFPHHNQYKLKEELKSRLKGIQDKQ